MTLESLPQGNQQVHSNTTTVRQRSKKTKNMVPKHSDNNDSGTENGVINHSKRSLKVSYKKRLQNEDNDFSGSDFEMVDHNDFDDLHEINLLENEEADALIPNVTIDVDNNKESSFFIALQVFFPFFAAGLGTVAAGLLLDHVQVIILVLLLLKAL